MKVSRITLTASIANIQRLPLDREVVIDADMLLAIYRLALAGLDALECWEARDVGMARRITADPTIVRGPYGAEARCVGTEAERAETRQRALTADSAPFLLRAILKWRDGVDAEALGGAVVKCDTCRSSHEVTAICSACEEDEATRRDDELASLRADLARVTPSAEVLRAIGGVSDEAYDRLGDSPWIREQCAIVDAWLASLPAEVAPTRTKAELDAWLADDEAPPVSVLVGASAYDGSECGERLASLPGGDKEPEGFCACGRRTSECDRSRKACVSESR